MAISFKLRLKVYMRDLFTCKYCRKAMNPLSDELTLDHVHPEGLSEEDNLVTACVTCNTRKGNRDAEQFKALVTLEAQQRVTLPKETDLSLDDLLLQASTMSKIHPSLIRNKGAQREVVHARTRFAVLARNAGYSLPSIGRFLNKHHTTVLHMIEKVAPNIPNCPLLRFEEYRFSVPPTTTESEMGNLENVSIEKQ